MDKLNKATHEGKITIGESELNCAVLKDGTRVITQSAVFKAFGRTKRGRAKNETRVPNMPSFIDANNLQPFINNELREVLSQHDYRELIQGKKFVSCFEVTDYNRDVYYVARFGNYDLRVNKSFVDIVGSFEKKTTNSIRRD